MKRFVWVGLLVAALLVPLLTSAWGALAARSRATVAVTAAPHIPSGAREIGAVSRGAAETAALVLRPRNERALRQFIASVTEAGSPAFHHYLAPGTFASRFGPTPTTIDAVKAQLVADGLRVTRVASDGLIVTFKASARQVEAAFHTRLASYKLADGTLGQATTTAVRVPSTISAAVSAVVGLDNLVHPHAVSIVRAPASARGTRAAAKAGHLTHPAGSPTACASAQTDAQQFGGLTDDQIANAYGAFGLYGAGDLAAGQRIAIYELEPFLPSDIQTFDTCYFGASVAGQMAGRLNTMPVDGGQPTGQGSGEAVLDVENVSAMAPGANIDVYEAPNTTFGGLDEYSAIINADADKVVTSSWGLCEQAVQLGEPGVQQAENFLFEQAAAQGQSVFSAAGDTGSDDCNAFRAVAPPAGQNPLSVDDPSSQPYVVAVGGTTIDNASTQPPQERVWNDGAEWGSDGGGISMSWAMPTWQLRSRVPGVVLPGSSDYTQANTVEGSSGYPPGFCQAYLAGAGPSTPCRTLPDVSAQADEFTGAITIFSTEFGG
ncbi:MAG: protease pro-enzyme activation domain-containing protein, partial [Solirubrobacteraceae bacterium]